MARPKTEKPIENDPEVQLATRIRKGLHRQVRYLALDRDTEVQALVTEALTDLLAKYPKRTQPSA